MAWQPPPPRTLKQTLLVLVAEPGVLEGLQGGGALLGVDGEQRGEEGQAALVCLGHPKLEAAAFGPQNLEPGLQFQERSSVPSTPSTGNPSNRPLWFPGQPSALCGKFWNLLCTWANASQDFEPEQSRSGAEEGGGGGAESLVRERHTVRGDCSYRAPWCV